MVSRALFACLIAVSINALGAEATTVAAHGIVVTTSGKGAAEAGRDVLNRGGTAMDAAMTAAMLQPCLALGSYVSYAGILNVVYFDAASGKVFNLNASYNTVRGEKEPLTIPGPSGASLAKKGFGAFATQPSGRTALVPGFLAGIEAAHERFGKRPFSEIISPAIRCAEDGVALPAGFVGMIASREAVLSRLPATRRVFFKKDGSRYQPGERLIQSDLARTLRAISKEGVRKYIYEGAWAQAFVDAVRRDGGKMTLDDLKAYQPLWTEPVQTRYRDYDVYAHGTPSSGGVTLLQMLNVAEAAKIADMPPYAQEPRSLFTLIQIAKLAPLLDAPEAANRLGAAFDIDLSPRGRLQQQTADKMWSAMQSGYFPTVRAMPATTAHSDGIVAIDERGNVAAVVHSINTVNWGSTGIFVGGISVPDSASFQQKLIASVTPGARLPDTTHPGLVLKNGKPVLGFSTIGAGMHLRALAALVSTLGQGMTPEQAIATPSLGGFDYSNAAKGELIATVGAQELSPEYMKALRELGQAVKEDDANRGYWIGASIDAKTGARHGGGARELQFGGSVAGQ